MIIGFVGIIVPFIPDIILIFLGALVYGLYTDFTVISGSIIIVFALLTILAFLIDVIASILGAKTQKASIYGQIGAVVGALFGLFTSGIFGIIIGPVLGVVIFEIIFAQKKLNQAAKAGLGALLGFVFGSLFKIVLAAFMIGWFIKLVLL